MEYDLFAPDVFPIFPVDDEQDSFLEEPLNSGELQSLVTVGFSLVPFWIDVRRADLSFEFPLSLGFEAVFLFAGVD